MANLLKELDQFCGTENYYRHTINRQVHYTDGVQHLAEKAGAYWLIDEIALSGIRDEPFQLWQLDVHDNKGVLTVTDGDKKIIMSKGIKYTDFPLPQIKLYFIDNIILLTSEY